MDWSDRDILDVLDSCCEQFTFPMLDNGYVYLAATRLSAFRSAKGWHLSIEVFGFSPRAGSPDVHVYNFGSGLQNRKTAENFVTQEAYENNRHANPHNDSQFFYPIPDEDWIDEEDGERVDSSARELVVRDQAVRIPKAEEYEALGIPLEDPPQVAVFELCRAIAGRHRNLVLATDSERRLMVPDDAKELLVLEEWNHPDVVDSNNKPSENETFRQIAKVLAEGDARVYSPTEPPNTHWSHWPEGGQL
ncbi:MAG: hypothetical protein AAF488_01545 [Planctomycetota bacterium]